MRPNPYEQVLFLFQNQPGYNVDQVMQDGRLTQVVYEPATGRKWVIAILPVE